MRVEKQLHSASSVGCRAADWEQDSHREREKCSAVTQAGLSRATTSRQSARKTQSRAIILKGRNTYISFTDMSSLRGSTAAGQSPSDQLAGGPCASSPTIAFSAFVCVCVSSWKSLTGDIRLGWFFKIIFVHESSHLFTYFTYWQCDSSFSPQFKTYYFII